MEQKTKNQRFLARSSRTPNETGNFLTNSHSRKESKLKQIQEKFVLIRLQEKAELKEAKWKG